MFNINKVKKGYVAALFSVTFGNEYTPNLRATVNYLSSLTFRQNLIYFLTESFSVSLLSTLAVLFEWDLGLSVSTT